MASSESKGTIILRQAAPKYSFQGKKLPREVENSQSYLLPSTGTISDKGEKQVEGNSESVISSSTQQTASSNQSDKNAATCLNGNKPIAVVGASCQVRPTVTHKSSESFKTPALTQISQSVNPQGLLKASISKNPTEGVSNSGASPHSGLTNSLSLPLLKTNFESSTNTSKDDLLPDLPLDSEASECKTAPGILSSEILQTSIANLTENFTMKEKIKELESTIERVQADLDVQLQVNGELKRLLVASVGEDLSWRVETLARDRAQLSIDLGGFNKKMTEDYENFDKVSIQADMWRSKYLASRVMIEELANARAYFSLMCQDSQDTLQQMLNERHELRSHLLEAYKVLQQVKDAFDPLNSHHSYSLRSTNILDLSRSCHQLAEAVRFRLLPAHVVKVAPDLEQDLWSDSVTKAEQLAHQILSRPLEPSGSLQSGSCRLLPCTGSSSPHMNRFHPHTKMENLTFNCCDRCKGEITVV